MNNKKTRVVRSTCKECGFPIMMNLAEGEVAEVTCPNPKCKNIIIIRSHDGRK